MIKHRYPGLVRVKKKVVKHAILLTTKENVHPRTTGRPCNRNRKLSRARTNWIMTTITTLREQITIHEID